MLKSYLVKTSKAGGQNVLVVWPVYTLFTTKMMLHCKSIRKEKFQRTDFLGLEIGRGEEGFVVRGAGCGCGWVARYMVNIDPDEAGQVAYLTLVEG